MAEEEKKVVASAENAEAKPAEEERSQRRPGGYEPHGSASAPRPGDRKFGNHRGRPSERRGGRGGFRRSNEPEYLERVVAINRISKTTAGGKNMRFSALVVIGDGKGKYSFASAKSGEVPDAIKKSLTQAKKKLYSIKIAKGGTLTHEVEGKFGATRVVLKPAKPGTGIVAGGPVRAILELAGIKNVVSKVYGSRTAVNVIRATHNGLSSLKEYGKIMVLRGLKTEEEVRAHEKAAMISGKGDK
ncbi:MAG: 30S ribosomal protein S5 [Bacilli bacterium]|nr:30S ribosomal protein S5 [Bacilli bacterium]